MNTYNGERVNWKIQNQNKKKGSIATVMSEGQSGSLNEPKPRPAFVWSYSFLALFAGFLLELLFRGLDRTSFLSSLPDKNRRLFFLLVQLIVSIITAVFLFHYFEKRISRSESALIAMLFFLPQSLFLGRLGRELEIWQDHILNRVDLHKSKSMSIESTNPDESDATITAIG